MYLEKGGKVEISFINWRAKAAGGLACSPMPTYPIYPVWLLGALVATRGQQITPDSSSRSSNLASQKQSKANHFRLPARCKPPVSVQKLKEEYNLPLIRGEVSASPYLEKLNLIQHAPEAAS